MRSNSFSSWAFNTGTDSSRHHSDRQSEEGRCHAQERKTSRRTPGGTRLPTHLRMRLCWHIHLVVHTRSLSITTQLFEILLVHHAELASNNRSCSSDASTTCRVDLLRPDITKAISSAAGLSSSTGRRSSLVMSSNQWHENSSKITYFVRNFASTSRQACLSSRAAGLNCSAEFSPVPLAPTLVVPLRPLLNRDPFTLSRLKRQRIRQCNEGTTGRMCVCVGGGIVTCKFIKGNAANREQFLFE